MLTFLADHRVKIKESDKGNKYLDLARELRKLWNMNVTEISFVIGALTMVLKGLEWRLEELEISGRIETIQTIPSLRSARVLSRV